MQNFKFGDITVLAVQFFNKIKWKKKKKKNKMYIEELEKTCFSVFPTCYVKIHLYFVNLLFCCMF